MPNKDYEVPILLKAITIIEYIKEKPEASFAEIQKDLGYAKSTTYQILQTLKKHRVLAQTETGKYCLGFKCLEWGNAMPQKIDINRISQGILQELAKTVGVSVHLAIKSGENKAVFINKIDGALYTIHNVVVGGDIAWQCGACGKVLFAWSSEQEQKEILQNIQYQAYTPHSVLSDEEFLKDIELTKSRGYAVDRMEWTDNVYGVGVPIFDYKGDVVAAMSCAMLSFDVEANGIESYAEHLKKSSQEITAKLSR